MHIDDENNVYLFMEIILIKLVPQKAYDGIIIVKEATPTSAME